MSIKTGVAENLNKLDLWGRSKKVVGSGQVLDDSSYALTE